MSRQTNRKIQYLAGLCVSANFMFTGATISWPSPAIPKFQSGEANVQITEVSQRVWEIANRDTTGDRAQISWVASLFAVGAIPGCFCGHALVERAGRRAAMLYGCLPGIIGAVCALLIC
ncbi:hypothetical protein MSG28_004011 [Choristoneura fumiferana]|uniref:Uncharacterized protein n=1 Tax=Choristoneura fumiferana TaxID=7141 RepID=A0ACC0KI28_CHOFU|nr:hypothetical protein MSG28_004011 [Choristoneura fumiferana]